MVDCQVRPCDVTDHDLLSALLSVPREEFVSDTLAELAYLDRNVEISDEADGRYLLAAGPLAKLLQLSAPQKNDVVLVVGAGSGYSCAVFSLLASSVVGVEENADLASQADEILPRLGYDNVAVLNSNPAEGWARAAPFDVIFVEGAVDFVPEALLDQLADNGRLVAVVGEGNSANATLYTKQQGIVGHRQVFNCSLPALPKFQNSAEFVF